MIETEEQRRWWFATHPEYSSSHKGKKNRKRTREKTAAEKNIPPEQVDAYVDDALQYLDGPVAELLKSTKRHFGTEAEAGETGPQAYRGVPTSDEQALTESHTALDLFDLIPARQLVKVPINLTRGLLRVMERRFINAGPKKKFIRWVGGMHPSTPTKMFKFPPRSTQTRRHWKNRAAEKGAKKKWNALDPENYERMKKKGLGPRRKHPKTGKLETMELHHTKKPWREQGKDVIELWPEKHAEVDPHRFVKGSGKAKRRRRKSGK